MEHEEKIYTDPIGYLIDEFTNYFDMNKYFKYIIIAFMIYLIVKKI